jgi:hypothetical protein
LFDHKTKKRKITQSSKLLNYILNNVKICSKFFLCNLEDVLEISTISPLSLGLLSLPNPSFSGIGKVRKFYQILIDRRNYVSFTPLPKCTHFFHRFPTGYPPNITGWKQMEQV